MSPRKWWRRRSLARRRRRAAAANRDQPLREFVYLDDVSVYSLLASRIGALATEFTDSQSTSLSSEVKSSGGVSTPVAKAQIGSTIKGTQSSGAQVMRKATVQSTFRDLNEFIRDELVLRSDVVADSMQLRDVAQLREEASRDAPWVLTAGHLRRGDMIEIEVELNADDTFRASTVMSTVFDLIRDLPQARGAMDTQALGEALTALRLLNGLLDGVVPIRGRATEYEHITVGEESFVVHHRAAGGLPEEAERRPLLIVGICSSELFWQDLRRVLFSSSRFRMLCRVAADGTSERWRPVKLADVLAGVVPGLDNVLDEVSTVLASMRVDAEEAGSPQENRFVTALELYALDLCQYYERELDAPQLIDLGVIATASAGVDHEDIKQRREAFDYVTTALEQTLAFDADPVVASRLRTTALMDSEVLNIGEADHASAVAGSAPSSNERYVECEIVAIYW